MFRRGQQEPTSAQWHTSDCDTIAGVHQRLLLWPQTDSLQAKQDIGRLQAMPQDSMDSRCGSAIMLRPARIPTSVIRCPRGSVSSVTSCESLCTLYGSQLTLRYLLWFANRDPVPFHVLILCRDSSRCLRCLHCSVHNAHISQWQLILNEGQENALSRGAQQIY